MVNPMAEKLQIARRFRGPDQSGNGGYVAGVLARHVNGPAVVRLKAPPPLDTDLRVLHEGGGVLRLCHGASVVAEARPQVPDLTPQPCPEAKAAEAAALASPMRWRHPLPGCFVCGTGRRPGDGLCILAGPLPDSKVWAAPWTPDASLADAAGQLRSEFLWSALDCPGGFAANETGGMVLLGEICARIDRLPEIGEPCIVLGWPLAASGRKLGAGSAVYDSHRRLLGLARATWIRIDETTPEGTSA